MEKNQSVMEKLDQLKSQLTGRKTTTGFVKFQMSIDDAALYIEAALRVEVEKRGNIFSDSDELQGHIVQIARLLECSQSLSLNLAYCCVAVWVMVKAL